MHAVKGLVTIPASLIMNALIGGMHSMRYQLFYFLCLLIGLSSAIKAEPIDYYSASVEVSSQSSRERATAAGEGLKQVLVRISGSTDVVLAPGISSSVSKASQYLDQYHYIFDRNDNGQKTERLVMSFSPNLVNRILTEASQSYWPTNRPKVLVWLVEDTADMGKQLVNDPSTAVIQGLFKASDARGLPILLPLLDLDDQLAISSEQVWTLDEDAIMDASERYNSDTVLIGRYTQTSQGKWWATWQFFHRGVSRVYDVRADEGAELAAQAMSPIADYLAGLYSVMPNTGSDSQLFVALNHVTNFKAYRQALTYIEQLAVVSSYQAVSIVNDTLLLGLQLNGDLSQLNSAISLDSKIEPSISVSISESPWSAIPAGTLNQPLQFRWVGG